MTASLTASPEFPEYGELTRFDFTVRNVGRIRVSDTAVTVYDVGPGLLQIIGWTTVTFQDWSAAGSVMWANPTGGAHDILAVADAFDATPEADEGNNNRSLAMGVGLPGQTIPDLVVTAIEISGHAHANESVTVNVTVRNAGTAPTPMFTLTVYDASAQQTIATYAETALAPLTSSLHSISWIPEVVDISRIRVTADSGGAVNEKNEGNNEGVLSVPVDPDPDCGPGLEGCHPECNVVIAGDWNILSALSYHAQLICVVDGNVHISGPEGSLTLDSSGLKFKDWTTSDLYGLFVHSGGTLITRLDPAAPPDWPYPKIFSTSSNDVFTFVAGDGSVLDLEDAKVDWLSGPALDPPNYPGGLWVRTPFVTATRLSIREAHVDGLVVGDADSLTPPVLISSPLVDLEVLDPGFGGSGGVAVVLRPDSQVELTGGNIQSTVSGEDGVAVLSDARLVASGLIVQGFPHYGIALDVEPPATTAGSLSLGGNSLIEGRVDANGVGISEAALRIFKADPSQTTQIQGTTVRHVRTGIIIEESLPTVPNLVAVDLSIVDVSTPTPLSGYKGIDVLQSTVTITNNQIGPQTVGARSIATGLLLTQASGTVYGNTVYRIREPAGSTQSPAGIDVVDSTATLVVAGGSVNDFVSGTSGVVSCGVSVSKTVTGTWSPTIDSVAISGGLPGDARVGICVLPGTNPTLLGPGRNTAGPHINSVVVGVHVNLATATIDGLRMERDIWYRNWDVFYHGICLIYTTAPVVVRNVHIKDGFNPGVEVGGCGESEDNPAQASDATVENSYIGHDPDRRGWQYCEGAVCWGHYPSNNGIRVRHGSSVDVLANSLVEYSDYNQVFIENPGPGLIEIRDSEFRDIVDSCAPLLAGTDCDPNRGLVLLYGVDTLPSGDDVIVENNRFFDGIWGLSIDPDPAVTFVTTTVSVLANLFQNQRYVGLGGCGQENWGGDDDCVGVVRNNEFKQQRAHAMVLSRSSWMVERNNLHENEGDGSDGLPSGAVFVTADLLTFRENLVLNTVGVGAAGVAVKIAEDSTAVIHDNRFEGNDIALLLISKGLYDVTNNPGVPICSTPPLDYCGFRGNGVGIMVQGHSPRIGATIMENEVDGLNQPNSMGIVFWEIDQDYTYFGDAFGNKVINNGFGISQRYPHTVDPGPPPVLVPYTLTVTALTDPTLLSGNGYGLWVDLDAKAVVFGNTITANGWAAGTRQSATTIRDNTFTDQVKGSIWVEGASTWGLADVHTNTITRTSPRFCISPPSFLDVQGVFVTSFANQNANPHLYDNTIDKVCLGIYTFNSDAGVNSAEGVHDNTITDVAQAITVEGNSISTFRANLIQNVDWGFSIRNSQPTIRDHIGPLDSPGILEFSRIGVFVTGPSAAPVVDNNKIATTVITANGVWTDVVSTASTWVTGNTITLLTAAPCPTIACFAGIRVSEASNVRVEGNTLEGAASLGFLDDSRTGLLVCSRVSGAGECVLGPGPFANPVVLRDNGVTNFWKGVWMHNAVRVQLGGPVLADRNTIGGVLAVGILETGGASAGAIIVATYNEVSTSLPANHGTQGVSVGTGTYRHNWVHNVFYPVRAWLENSVTVTMEYNVIEDAFGVGINAFGTGTLFLHGNEVRRTGLSGAGGIASAIRLGSGLSGGRVTCNLVENNPSPPYTDPVYGLTIQTGNGFQVYKNAFKFNTHTPQGYDDVPNAWDNGAGIGNFWTDWSGSGPYLIDGGAGAQDNYPLGADPTGPGCTA